MAADPLVVENVANQVKDAVGEIVGIHGGVRGIIHAVPEVIQHVEAVGAAAALSGQAKKELALAVLFQLVPLPWWAPRAVVEPLLSILIDMAVAAVNKRLKSA
jgi:hypothetical protein